jgi:hypothetical protein
MSKKKASKWILGVWDGTHLTPFAPYDHDMMDRLPRGRAVKVETKQVRNVTRHRLYRVILRVVVQNTDMFATEDGLHKTLLLACGVTEPVMSLKSGSIQMVPSSTAFDEMDDEEEFKAYFDQAMQLISEKVLPGTDIDELLAEAKRQAQWKEAA